MSINVWGSDDPAQVAKGGTGAATFTSGGLLLGNTTSAVTATSALTTGQSFIGSTGNPPTTGTIAGTASQINIDTSSPGNITAEFTTPSVELGGTDAAIIPVGTTAQEPSASNGMIRYDSDTDKLRGVVGGSWGNLIGAGGTGGSWDFITSTTTGGAASVEFDNTVITSTYVHYWIQGINCNAVTSSPLALCLRLSNDNGSSFHSTGYVNSPTTYTNRLPIFTTSPSDGLFDIHIFNPRESGVKTCVAGFSCRTGTAVIFTSVGLYDTAEDNNAIQFVATGNISGTYVVYGWAD